MNQKNAEYKLWIDYARIITEFQDRYPYTWKERMESGIESLDQDAQEPAAPHLMLLPRAADM